MESANDYKQHHAQLDYRAVFSSLKFEDPSEQLNVTINFGCKNLGRRVHKQLVWGGVFGENTSLDLDLPHGTTTIDGDSTIEIPFVQASGFPNPSSPSNPYVEWSFWLFNPPFSLEQPHRLMMLDITLIIRVLSGGSNFMNDGPGLTLNLDSILKDATVLTEHWSVFDNNNCAMYTACITGFTADRLAQGQVLIHHDLGLNKRNIMTGCLSYRFSSSAHSGVVNPFGFCTASSQETLGAPGSFSSLSWEDLA